MKILVVGGAGYIGSVCAELLLEQGHGVTIFDNLSEGHRRALDPRAEFVEGDLVDRQLIEKILAKQQPDAVMHFAANALVGESMQNPSKYFRNNIANGLNLLDAVISAGVVKVALGAKPAIESFGTDYETPDGSCIRDYIRIVDLARAHILAVNATKGDFYNLGTGGGASVREVIDSCRKSTGRNIDIVEKP